MAKIIARVSDPVRKIESVTIEDEFGARVVLQHPLLLDDYDPDAEEAKTIETMRSNAEKFKQRSQRASVRDSEQ